LNTLLTHQLSSLKVKTDDNIELDQNQEQRLLANEAVDVQQTEDLTTHDMNTDTAHAGKILSNETAISVLQSQSVDLGEDITGLLAQVGEVDVVDLESRVSIDETNLANHTTTFATVHGNQIQLNKSQVEANSLMISNNSSDIATNATNLVNHDSDSTSTHGGQIETNRLGVESVVLDLSNHDSTSLVVHNGQIETNRLATISNQTDLTNHNSDYVATHGGQIQSNKDSVSLLTTNLTTLNNALVSHNVDSVLAHDGQIETNRLATIANATSVSDHDSTYTTVHGDQININKIDISTANTSLTNHNSASVGVHGGQIETNRQSLITHDSSFTTVHGDQININKTDIQTANTNLTNHNATSLGVHGGQINTNAQSIVSLNTTLTNIQRIAFTSTGGGGLIGPQPITTSVSISSTPNYFGPAGTPQWSSTGPGIFTPTISTVGGYNCIVPGSGRYRVSLNYAILSAPGLKTIDMILGVVSDGGGLATVSTPFTLDFVSGVYNSCDYEWVVWISPPYNVITWGISSTTSETITLKWALMLEQIA
jgi:hypothetical protein